MGSFYGSPNCFRGSDCVYESVCVECHTVCEDKTTQKLLEALLLAKTKREFKKTTHKQTEKKDEDIRNTFRTWFSSSGRRSDLKRLLIAFSLTVLATKRLKTIAAVVKSFLFPPFFNCK